jgi:proteasome lid subunit RPN8/RPN11
MPNDKLIVRHAQWELMVAHVARWWPEEACGLLGGPTNRVERVYLVENVYHSRTAYLMAADAQIQAMIELEGLGWDVNGIFHSHPAGPLHPSPTDVAQAYYPDAAYVILAPSEHGVWEGRAFAIVAGQVQPVELTLVA